MSSESIVRKDTVYRMNDDHGPTGLIHPSRFVREEIPKRNGPTRLLHGQLQRVFCLPLLHMPSPSLDLVVTITPHGKQRLPCTFPRGIGILPIPGRLQCWMMSLIRAMMEKSGAVAAYIDRKALDTKDLVLYQRCSTGSLLSGSRKVRLWRWGICHGRCTVLSGRWPGRSPPGPGVFRMICVERELFV